MDDFDSDFTVGHGFEDGAGDGGMVPGSGLQFEDVTSLFKDAADDMDPETLLFMEGFTLQDAMSAFEIGEPRLDTGYIGDNPHQSFNPLQPLLPEEICWVLDKAFGYEMEWHSGKLLPHTVFTLQYTHCLQDIEPDVMAWNILSDVDSERPIELVTVVLGSCVQALLKCCDLAWNEMHANDMIQDAEDWQSDKAEIPILEGLPVKFIVARLEEAAIWVQHSSKVSVQWKEPLISRIRLRKALLELYHVEAAKHPLQHRRLADEAETLVKQLASSPAPNPNPGSPVFLAFDPYISRCLNTCVPVRVIPAPTYDVTWKLLSSFLEGLQELNKLISKPNLATWGTVGKLRVWLNEAPREAFVRSLTQSAFYNGILVLDQYTFPWVLDQLFSERIGVPWSKIRESITKAWSQPYSASNIITQIERKMYKLVINHIKLHWMNLPRMRRKLMKSVVDWHVVYDLFVELVDGIGEDTPHNRIIRKLPEVILTFRLEAMREIVCSGFQLELYAPYERPFAYWYLTIVLHALGGFYDEIMGALEKDSDPWKELHFKKQLSAIIQSISKTSLLLTLPFLPVDWDEALQACFCKRYKWAFRPDYQRTKSDPVAHPELQEFMRFWLDIVEQENTVNPRQYIEKAQASLKEMVESRHVGPWIGDETPWPEAMLKFIGGLQATCEEMTSLPNSLSELGSTFDSKRLKWDPSVHPWFPRIEKLKGQVASDQSVDL